MQKKHASKIALILFGYCMLTIGVQCYPRTHTQR